MPRAPYELMVVLDGEQCLELIPLPTMLEPLAAEGKAPAFVAVLVDTLFAGWQRQRLPKTWTLSVSKFAGYSY